MLGYLNSQEIDNLKLNLQAQFSEVARGWRRSTSKFIKFRSTEKKSVFKKLDFCSTEKNLPESKKKTSAILKKSDFCFAEKLDFEYKRARSEIIPISYSNGSTHKRRYLSSDFEETNHQEWRTYNGILQHFEELEEQGLIIHPLNLKGYSYFSAANSFGQIQLSSDSIIKTTTFHSSPRWRKFSIINSGSQDHKKYSPLSNLPTEATLQFMAKQIVPKHVLPQTVSIEFSADDHQKASVKICMPKVTMWLELRKTLTSEEVILKTAFIFHEQLLLALKDLHTKKIFHRDIKLANLGYITDKRTPVFLDWGLGTCPLTEKRGYSTENEDGDKYYLVHSRSNEKRDIAALDLSILAFLCEFDISSKCNNKSVEIVRKEMLIMLKKLYESLKGNVCLSDTITARNWIQQLILRLWKSHAFGTSQLDFEFIKDYSDSQRYYGIWDPYKNYADEEFSQKKLFWDPEAYWEKKKSATTTSLSIHSIIIAAISIPNTI